jgi:FkbM family methyltransferase
MSETLRSIQVALAKQNRGIKQIAKGAAGLFIRLGETLTGFRMTNEVNLMNVLMLVGRWERGTTVIAQHMLKPGMVVVDIGAHVGYYTRMFSRCVGSEGKVFAFEPHPDNRALLQQNVRTFPNVSVLPYAVGDTPGTSVFFESAVGSGSHSLIESRYPHARELHVEKVSLDSFFTDQGVTVNFMKIDVEGAEHEVLDGGTRLLSSTHAPDMLIEFSPSIITSRGLAPASLLTKLQGFGYTLYMIDEERHTLIPLETFPTVEAFVSSVKKVANLLATKSPERAAPLI